MKKFLDSKKQIGIRIPQDLDRQLENHVRKIGISKPAFILSLIYKEICEKSKNQEQNK